MHPNVKACIADPANDEFSTTLVLRSFNNSTRVMKNAVSKRILEIEAAGDPDFSDVAALANGENGKRMFQETGDTESAMWSCGQSVGLIESIVPVQTLLDDIVAQAEAQLQRANSLVSKL